MKHVEWYFHTVQKYREGLNRINAKYDAQIEDKKNYAGSAGYTADIEKIEQERAAEISALRDDCRDDFNRCLAEMEKNANARPAVPPTAEQLNIIQLLKMKERVTRDELRHAANSMGECSLALSILEEIARAHDIMGFHAGGTGVSDQFVSDAIRAFAQSAKTTLTLERTNQRRQLLNPPPGTGGGPNGNYPSHADVEKFRVDLDPDSAKSYAARWGGVPPEVYEAFCAAVNSPV